MESLGPPAETAALPGGREDEVGSAVALSVVVPVFNESAGVASTLDELREQMSALGPEVEWEVIVVDDGSTDGTRAAIEPFLSPRLRVVGHERNRGYGAALKTGVLSARHPWIVTTDADGTYPSIHIPDLLAHCGEYQMVVGARIGQKARIPWLRRPAKWLLKWLASYLSGVEIVDLNSGLRVFPRKLARRLAHVLPNGFSYSSSITLSMLSMGYSVKYVPIEYRRRSGISKIRPIRDTLTFINLTLRTVVYFDPMRVLLPVSVLFVLASVAVGVLSVLLTGELMDVTTLLLFVAGVQIFSLGLIADAINRRLP